MPDKTDYKLAKYEDRFCTFREVKRIFQSSRSAKDSVSSPGRYRISERSPEGYRDIEYFEIKEGK